MKYRRVKEMYIMNVFKDIHHLNRYHINVIRGSFFSQLQILSNCLADNEKNVALHFFVLCQSTYLSVSLGQPRKELNHHLLFREHSGVSILLYQCVKTNEQGARGGET